jgi:soluble lytic murein transglycosylase
LTIAGYNAGKARVLSWVAARGDPRDPKVDVIDWIEAIPFDETRNYVMRVLENELAYRARRGEAVPLRALNQSLGRGP